MTVLKSSLVFRTSLFLFLLAWIAKGRDGDVFSETEGAGPSKVFNVMLFDAVADGRTDNSQAFLKAWSEACNWGARATVMIPPGTFKLFPVVFSGPCKSRIDFIIQGTLVASTSNSALSSESWIIFRKVENLTVAGGGTLDGQGASVWHLSDCTTNPRCITLPTLMTFDSITNASVHHLVSLNSPNTHIKVHESQKIRFRNIRISAPKDSPNTDGIKIGNSYRIGISRTIIQTGDDCVAILSGSRKISITNVFCGPGHGISIGSLGGHAYPEYDVDGISVINSVFDKSDNGLRIKTYARDSKPLTARNIVYKDIHMIDVKNPIIIDQQYCPSSNQCEQQVSSNVQISNVTFRNIWGTSSSKEAVTLKCSKTKPCKNIVMENIKLPYNGPEGPATTLCSNVMGNSYGSHIPPSCL